jgi:hypothetical protein
MILLRKVSPTSTPSYVICIINLDANQQSRCGKKRRWWCQRPQARADKWAAQLASSVWRSLWGQVIYKSTNSFFSPSARAEPYVGPLHTVCTCIIYKVWILIESRQWFRRERERFPIHMYIEWYFDLLNDASMSRRLICSPIYALSDNKVTAILTHPVRKT